MSKRVHNSIGLLLCLCLSWLNVHAQTTEQRVSNYEAGAEAYRAGDFRRAFDAWSLGAYEGVTEAQYNLGVLYLEGRGVENNIEQARNWFLKAAEQGHVEAQYNLGHMALTGMGMKKNTAETLGWWKLAAQGGYPQAQFNYGRALYLGVDLQKDKVAGLEFILAAAAQNDQRAIDFLQENSIDVDAYNRPEPQAVALAEQASADMPAPQPSPEEKPVAAVSDSTENSPGAANQDTPAQDSRAQASKTGLAKNIKIVRERREIQSEYLIRTSDTPVIVFSSVEMADVVSQLAPASLVKVIRVHSDRLNIVAAGPLSLQGWIWARDLAYTQESAQQMRAEWLAASFEVGDSEAMSAVPGDQVKTLTAAEKAGSKSQTDQGFVSEKQASPSSSTAISEGTGASAKIDDNLWLYIQEPDAHVIHLFTMLDREKALSIADQDEFRERAQTYSTQIKQQQWVFVLLGPYGSAQAAISAQEALADQYRKNSRVRAVSLIANNRCAKRESLNPAQAEGLEAYCLD